MAQRASRVGNAVRRGPMRRRAIARRAATGIADPVATAIKDRAGIVRRRRALLRRLRGLTQTEPCRLLPQVRRLALTAPLAVMAGHGGIATRPVATAKHNRARMLRARPVAMGRTSHQASESPGIATAHAAKLTASPLATANLATVAHAGTATGPRAAMASAGLIVMAAGADRSSSAPRPRAKAKVPIPTARSPP